MNIYGGISDYRIFQKYLKNIFTIILFNHSYIVYIAINAVIAVCNQKCYLYNIIYFTFIRVGTIWGKMINNKLTSLVLNLPVT